LLRGTPLITGLDTEQALAIRTYYTRPIVTKLVISIKNLIYKDRLKMLKLPTFKYRRIRGDMIELYKILTMIVE